MINPPSSYFKQLSHHLCVTDEVKDNGRKKIHNCRFELEKKVFCYSFLTCQLPTNRHVIVSSDVSCFLIKQVCARHPKCACWHQNFHDSSRWQTPAFNCRWLQKLDRSTLLMLRYKTSHRTSHQWISKVCFSLRNVQRNGWALPFQNPPGVEHNCLQWGDQWEVPFNQGETEWLSKCCIYEWRS